VGGRIATASRPAASRRAPRPPGPPPAAPPPRRPAIAPALRPLQQIGLGRFADFAALDQPQAREGAGGQRWRQGGGVAEGTAALQQPFHHHLAAGQERPAAAEGLAEGTADQGDRANVVTQSPASRTQHSQGVGLIQQQRRPEALAKGGQSRHVGAGALHREQTFAQYQEALVGSGTPGLAEPAL